MNNLKTGIYEIIVVEKEHFDFQVKCSRGWMKKEKCSKCWIDSIEYIELRDSLNKTESGVIYSKHELTVDELDKVVRLLSD